MRVLVSGSKNWVDYNPIIRTMAVTLDRWRSTRPDETRITFVHSAASPAENMVTEYIGKVEDLLKQKGYTIDEEIVRVKGDLLVKKSTSMYDLCDKNIDAAIMFVRDTCKRTQTFASIASARGITTEIVKG
jgi:hypothetical protein